MKKKTWEENFHFKCHIINSTNNSLLILTVLWLLMSDNAERHSY
jgi:hypothetical protein